MEKLNKQYKIIFILSSLLSLSIASRLVYIYLYNNTDLLYYDKNIQDKEKFSYEQAKRIAENITNIYEINNGIKIPITFTWKEKEDDPDYLNAFAHLTDSLLPKGNIDVHKGIFQYRTLDTQGIYLIISHEIAHIVDCCKNNTSLSYCKRCSNNYKYSEDIADYSSANIMRNFFNNNDYENVMDSAKKQIKPWYSSKKEKKKFLSWIPWPTEKGCLGDHSDSTCRINIITNGMRNEKMDKCAITIK